MEAGGGPTRCRQRLRPPIARAPTAPRQRRAKVTREWMAANMISFFEDNWMVKSERKEKTKLSARIVR